MAQVALDLYHASRTGQFPRPGALRSQVTRVGAAYRYLLAIVALAERLRGAQAGLGLAGAQEAPEPRKAKVDVGGLEWQEACERRGWTFWDALGRLNGARDDDHGQDGTPAEDAFWAELLAD